MSNSTDANSPWNIDAARALYNIRRWGAKYYDINLGETSWHDLGVHPQKNREETAAKGAATRERRVQR